MFERVEPVESVLLDATKAFDCRRSARRHPRETKGVDYAVTTEATNPCCGPNGGCC
jgi:hypothetical protein